MIQIKSPAEICSMRKAGTIAKAALLEGAKWLRTGITTREVDERIEKFIRDHGAAPSFKGYGGFPASACISINDEVIHGIPGARAIQDGDIVSIDVGAFYEGYHGDCAMTFPVGTVAGERLALIRDTRQSFFEGIKYAKVGYRISDISSAIQTYVEARGYSVVRPYVGHGIGKKLHEDPEVPNYGTPGRGLRLVAGMTLAVEPMINLGTCDIRVLADEWTVVTADGKPSAHYENTILITDGEPEILTPGSEDYL